MVFSSGCKAPRSRGGENLQAAAASLAFTHLAQHAQRGHRRRTVYDETPCQTRVSERSRTFPGAGIPLAGRNARFCNYEESSVLKVAQRTEYVPGGEIRRGGFHRRERPATEAGLCAGLTRRDWMLSPSRLNFYSITSVSGCEHDIYHRPDGSTPTCLSTPAAAFSLRQTLATAIVQNGTRSTPGMSLAKNDGRNS